MNTLELRIPPLVLTILFALLMRLIAVALPVGYLHIPMRVFGAGSLAIVGMAFVVAGVVAFRRAKTTLNPTTPDAASIMVTSGVYRISRNPMYVGFLLLLAAWAVHLSYALPALLLSVFVWYITRFQIVPEERALAEKFGDEFARYAGTVRRWF